MIRTVLMLSMIALLSGCGAPQIRDTANNYDFGLPRAVKEATPRLQYDLTVADVSAPAWMDSTAMYYRLGYVDPARPQAYALSRWVMPPAALLTQRLRGAAVLASRAGVFSPTDGVRSEYAVRLELEEFSQVFDSAESSRAVVRVRASLLRGRNLVAQQAFNVEQPAATPNAEGGVRALVSASDDLAKGMIDWLAANMRK